MQGVLDACVADTCFYVTIGSVGIADTRSSGLISVYPNPGNELFTVASDVADGPYRYEVLDGLGRKLMDSGTQLTPFTLGLFVPRRRHLYTALAWRWSPRLGASGETMTRMRGADTRSGPTCAIVDDGSPAAATCYGC